MPLIVCPDCERQVSSKAPTCPHCGCPLQPGKAPPFGSFQKGHVTRPDFWHDPNVGIVGCAIIVIIFVVLVRLQGC